MSSDLQLKNVARQVYLRALTTAWRNKVELHDPSTWLLREPELEEKALRDADIAHAVGYRRHLIAGKAWQVSAVNTRSKAGVMSAAIATALIANIKHFTQARMNLARAFFSGARFAEIVLEPRTLTIGDGKPRVWAVPVALKDMDKRRFRIVPVDGDGTLSAKWQVWNVATGEWVDQSMDGYRRTVKHVYSDDEATLGYGRGLREALGWWWYAKQHVFQESLGAVEKFARGILTAKVRGARDAETGKPNTTLIAEWQQVLEDMVARNVLVYDSEDTVEMVRLDGTGWQLLAAIRQELRSAIFTLILGANLTTSADSGGSYALAQIQENSTEALVQFDREAMEETFSDDLIAGCLWHFNYANIRDLGLEGEPPPRFKITQDKQSDPEKRVSVAKSLHEMGIDLPLVDVLEQAGYRVPEQGEMIVEARKEPPPPPPGQPSPFGGGGGGDGGGMPFSMDEMERRLEVHFARASAGPAPAPAPNVNVAPAQVNVAPAQVHVAAPPVNVAAPVVNVDVHLPGREAMRITRGADGRATGVEPVRFAWSESDHPRDDHGRFVSAGEMQDAAFDPEKAAELRSRVTDPEQRKKLEAVIADPGIADEGSKKEREAAAEAAKPKRGRPSTEQRREQLRTKMSKFFDMYSSPHANAQEMQEFHDSTGLTPSRLWEVVRVARGEASAFSKNPSQENAEALANAIESSLNKALETEVLSDDGRIYMPQVRRLLSPETFRHVANLLRDPVAFAPAVFRPIAKTRARALEIEAMHKGWDAPIDPKADANEVKETHNKASMLVDSLLKDTPGHGRGSAESLLVDEMSMWREGGETPDPITARQAAKQAQAVASGLLRMKKMGMLERAWNDRPPTPDNAPWWMRAASMHSAPKIENTLSRWKESGYTPRQAAAFYSPKNHAITFAPTYSADISVNTEKAYAHKVTTTLGVGTYDANHVNYLESEGMESTAVHEFGHALHMHFAPEGYAAPYNSGYYEKGSQKKYNGFSPDDKGALIDVPESLLSEYGRQNPHELVAETFVRINNGWPVDQRVMRVYKKFGGYLPKHVRERVAGDKKKGGE